MNLRAVLLLIAMATLAPPAVAAPASEPDVDLNSMRIYHVGGVAALRALASTRADVVVREGFAAPGDAPPLTYLPSPLPCALNAGSGDGGSQVPSADGKCWVANFSSGPVDVREWGAVCNGNPAPAAIAADVAALNAAAAYVESRNGGAVLIPTAMTTGAAAVSPYGCFSALTINNNNVTIEGVAPTSGGAGGSRLIAATLTATAVTVNHVSAFTLRDVLVTSEGRGASGGQTAGQLVLLNGTLDSQFANVEITYGWDDLKFNNVGVFRWFGGQLRDDRHTAWTITGDYRQNGGGGDYYVYGLIVDMDQVDGVWPTYQPAAGIYITQNGGSITLDGVDVLHHHYNLWINPSSGGFVSWVYSSNSYYDSCDYPTGGRGTAAYYNGGVGIYVTPNGRGTANGGSFANVWSSTCQTNIALQADSASLLSGYQFTNLHSVNAGGAAVYLKNAKDVSFTAPLIGGSSQSRSGQSPQIDVDSGADHVTIVGGRVGGPVEEFATVMASHNLQIESGFTGRLSVSDVDMSGAGTSAVSNLSTSGLVTITNSPGFNPQGVRTLTPGASPWSYKAGAAPETLVLTGGSGVSAAYATGGAVCTAAPCLVPLSPNQTVRVTYSAPPAAFTNRQ